MFYFIKDPSVLIIALRNYNREKKGGGDGVITRRKFLLPD